MTGTGKWILIGSVTVIAFVGLVFLSGFIWMIVSTSGANWVENAWAMPRISQMAPGWMGGRSGMLWSESSSMWDLQDTDPGVLLTIEIVQERLEDSLLRYADLEIGEIMIFDNHAYAQIIESGTGIGAMEILVDPRTLGISPEHGPNMMWNLKYSSMHGTWRMGSTSALDEVGTMPISPEAAIAAGQAYLDLYSPGLSIDDQVVPFYGYYTIHTLRDNDVVGMLSVHGYSAQVVPHTWHGEFVVMNEANHDE